MLNNLRKNVDCLTLSCQPGEHKCHGGTELTMFQLLGEDTAGKQAIMALDRRSVGEPTALHT